ncbi:hypothetical protein [Yersinia enterocolitica]|nr:hypothetical protein [Yersinia enterocolitica]
MQDAILRRVWDFYIEEQVLSNSVIEMDSVINGIAVFIKNGNIAER